MSDSTAVGRREGICAPRQCGASRCSRSCSRFRAGGASLVLLFVSALWSIAALPSAALAQPTQEEVFRSISENVGEQGGSARGAAAFLGGMGLLVLLLVLFSRRQQRKIMPKPLQHHGKLLKEVMKTVPLKPAELKQLKLLVDDSRSRDEAPLESPLTLLLCPSVLAKAMQNHSGKVDRKAVAGLVRKLAAHEASRAA